jgi:hypothetical protein
LIVIRSPDTFFTGSHNTPFILSHGAIFSLSHRFSSRMRLPVIYLRRKMERVEERIKG